MERMHGEAVGWHSTYGWIKADNAADDAPDHFVHFKQIRGHGFRQLIPGQRVTFKAGKDDHGRPQAVDVALDDGW